MSDTTDTSTDGARPWRRGPRPGRKAWVTGGAALTVALLGAGVAFATIGGGANPQACEKAMRSMLSQAMSGHDLSDAGKPDSCRGLSDAQLQELAGRAFADSPAGALLRGLAGSWDAGSDAAPVDGTAACRAEMAEQMKGASDGTFTFTRRGACTGMSDTEMQQLADTIGVENGAK